MDKKILVGVIVILLLPVLPLGEAYQVESPKEGENLSEPRIAGQRRNAYYLRGAINAAGWILIDGERRLEESNRTFLKKANITVRSPIIGWIYGIQQISHWKMTLYLPFFIWVGPLYCQKIRVVNFTGYCYTGSFHFGRSYRSSLRCIGVCDDIIKTSPE